MTTYQKLHFIKGSDGKSMRVVRHFAAPVEQVWKAWTEKEWLDRWWAPKPWRAETKSLSFKEGGEWMYCMVGPEAERHWCKVEFHAINAPHFFTYTSLFCEANGIVNQESPVMTWKNEFSTFGNGTDVHVEFTFPDEIDLM